MIDTTKLNCESIVAGDDEIITDVETEKLRAKIVLLLAKGDKREKYKIVPKDSLPEPPKPQNRGYKPIS